MKAKPSTRPAKSKRKSGRSRKCSRSKSGGPCPEYFGWSPTQSLDPCPSRVAWAGIFLIAKCNRGPPVQRGDPFIGSSAPDFPPRCSAVPAAYAGGGCETPRSPWLQPGRTEHADLAPCGASRAECDRRRGPARGCLQAFGNTLQVLQSNECPDLVPRYAVCRWRCPAGRPRPGGADGR